MNTVESDQLTSLDNVIFFLKSESERLNLQPWAVLAVNNTEFPENRVTIYGTEPAPSYKWVSSRGATTDEAAKDFANQTNKTVIAAKKREQARKLMEEAEAIDAG